MGSFALNFINGLILVQNRFNAMVQQRLKSDAEMEGYIQEKETIIRELDKKQVNYVKDLKYKYSTLCLDVAKAFNNVCHDGLLLFKPIQYLKSLNVILKIYIFS